MVLRTDKHLRAGLYPCVSTEDRGQDHETQLRPLREYAERCGFTVVGELIDHVSVSPRFAGGSVVRRLARSADAEAGSQCADGF